MAGNTNQTTWLEYDMGSRQELTYLEEGMEVTARQEFHHQVVLFCGLERIVHLHHEGIVQRRQDVTFSTNVLQLIFSTQVRNERRMQ